MIEVNELVSGKKYMLIQGPRPISEARKDGTKYVVWDKVNTDWNIAFYDNEINAWMFPNGSQMILAPTHFVEYFPDPTENKDE